MGEPKERRQRIRGWPYEGPMKTSNIRVPEPLYERFAAVAEKNRRTFLVELLLAMEEHVERETGG